MVMIKMKKQVGVIKMRTMLERVEKIVLNSVVKMKRWVTNMKDKYIYGDLYSTIDDKSRYKEFLTFEECREWGDYYSDWAKRYKGIMSLFKKIKGNCALEVAPVECYCGYLYREVNEFLRFGYHSDKKLYDKMADILIMTLCSAPKIKDDIVVYRVVNDVFIKELIRNNKLPDSIPTQEKGFMSTSLLKDIVNVYSDGGSGLYLLKIYVPKGTVGIYVNTVTRRDEEEILLAPNNYLRLIEYPYYYESYSIKIFECQLISFV